MASDEQIQRHKQGDSGGTSSIDSGTGGGSPGYEFLWRSDDPDETFSDWTIEIIKVIDSSSSSSSNQNETNTNTNPTSTKTTTELYYVHKCILSSGKRRSGYFSRVFSQSLVSSSSSSSSSTPTAGGRRRECGGRGDHTPSYCSNRHGDCNDEDDDIMTSNTNFLEGRTSVSQIELHPLTAKCFPEFLDFLYTEERPLQICTETATALYWLGDYFEVPQLLNEVDAFLGKNMDVDTIHTYFEHSQLLLQQHIMTRIQRFVHNNIEEILDDHYLVMKAHPSFWADTLSFPSGSSGGTSSSRNSRGSSTQRFLYRSHHISRLVSQIASHNIEQLNRDIFDRLTSESIMPHIDTKAVLTLCDLDDSLAVDPTSNHDDDDDVDKKKREELHESNNKNQPILSPLEQRCVDALADSLSSLKMRCIDALAEDWKSIVDDAELREELRRRKPSFLVELLYRSLQEASASTQKQEWINNITYDSD